MLTGCPADTYPPEPINPPRVEGGTGACCARSFLLGDGPPGGALRRPRSTSGQFAILGRVVESCWSLFRAGLTLAAVLAIALGAFLYFRLDDEAQRLCEATLGRQLEPFGVRVGAARVHPGHGVTMYEVEVVERLPYGPPRGVLQVEEVQLHGDFDVATLMSGRPVIRRVVLKSPRVAATLRADGSWNIADLRPPQGAGPPPRFEVQNATVLLVREESGSPAAVGLSHVDAVLEPTESGEFRVAVTARDTLAKSAELRGVVARDGSNFALDFELREVTALPTLAAACAALGMPGGGRFPVEGALNASGRVGRTPDRPLDWRVAFALEGGVCRLPGIERPLRELSVRGDARPEGVVVEALSARWSDALLLAAGRRQGWSPNASLAMRCRAEGLDAQTLPIDVLPEPVRRVWDRFRPRGRADAAFDLAFDGRAWATRATLNAREASFEDAEKFPYRLTDAAGEVLVNGGVKEDPTPPAPGPATIDVRLQGLADGAPALVTAAFRGVSLASDSTPQRARMPVGWVEISGNSIPVTDRLVGAIPDAEARLFVESLRPAGRIDVRWRAERTTLDEPEPAVALNLRMVDCRMLYDRFPYPLSGVTGWVEQRGKRWRFYELRSRDRQGRTVVEGNGSLEPSEAGCRFVLNLTGAGTPLDQPLFDALPERGQQAWALLRPRGQIDFAAEVVRECGQQEASVRLRMTPHRQNLAVEAPLSESGERYRLERIDGEFEWADERLTFRGARAEHGRTVYTSDGSWDALDGGGWRLELVGFNADRLDFNREFLLAAPGGLRGVVEELRPQGAFHLSDSRFEVAKASGPTGGVTARWRVGLHCHQASLESGVRLDGLSGVVRLSGQSDGSAAATAGELDLDSVFWNDLQLTRVQGPLWADGVDCFLGEGASRKLQGTAARPVTAQAYGGRVELNSWIRHGGAARYGVAVGLGDVDVTRLSSEWLRRPETLQGRLNGQLELQGTGSSMYGLTGRGALRVDDADLYELPLFLSLLKYLRNRAPDNTAFNTLETKFAVDGNDLRFESFDLLGDAVSLYGKGTATLQKDVDLTFASLVGRSEFAVPVLKAFVSSASEQLLRLRVVGPIEAPEVRREVLPAVGNVFEQLQAELGSRSAAGAPRPAATARR